MDTKKYKMLNTVTGSHDGLKVRTFRKGETYDLGPELAEQFYHQGAITEVGANAKANPAEARETKVTAPAEYKGEEGEAGIDPKTQRIEELNATARDHYGLDTDTTMAPQEIRDAIDVASDDGADESPAPPTAKNATKKRKK